MPVNHDDCDVAAQLARDTGRHLLRLRCGQVSDQPDQPGRSERPGGCERPDGRDQGHRLEQSELRDLGDKCAQEYLSRALAQARPNDIVLSEEAPDPAARIGANRVWIIDPVDGTREFAETDRTDWAVHVALWQDGDLACGAVALPALDEVYCSCDPPRSPQRDTRAVKVAVSRSRPPAFLPALVRDLGCEPVPIGSAGAKCAAVWKGQVDAYVHAGGQYEWDSAAPVAVARAAGLHTSRIDGSPLRYNRPDPYLPDLLICRPELAEPLLTSIAREAGTR